MEKVKVTFQPDEETVEVEKGTTLLEAANQAGVDINSLCGGEGVCGKCRLILVKGDVEASNKALSFLSKKELDKNFVLACQTRVLGDTEVVVPPESRREEEQILVSEEIVQFDEPRPFEDHPASRREIRFYQPLMQKHFLKLPPPTLEDNVSDADRILRELNKKFRDVDLDLEFKCLKGLAGLLRSNDWKITTTSHVENGHCVRVVHIDPGDTSGKNFGIAVDVGTTTIVAELVDLRTGKVLSVEASHNQQARYGEDVISRMIYACTKGGINPLNQAVINTINALVASLISKNRISVDEISCIVAAGNTTMTHLLLGLEPCTIRIEPYVPTADQFPPVLAREIRLQASEYAILRCLPGVSSYVGGDITAGVLSSHLSDSARIGALIDIGTNGEIVIGNNEWLVCCSASAGPAFEGGGSKCGMRATRGAIQKVVIDGEKVSYVTIGNAKPRGICGSGIIDTIAQLLLNGIIDQAGHFIKLDHPHVRIEDDVPEFVLAFEDETDTGEKVVLTEDDIGNLIKSKGAILAAMKVLVESVGLSFADIEELFVAGGFGNFLDIENSILIGLLPDIPKERIKFIGNSSLAGARMCMLSYHAFEKAETISKQMTSFELSVNKKFMDEFVASLFLPHTDMSLFPSVREKLKNVKVT